MKVLVACEESQAVTIELRKLGHEAYSCDILECSGGYPEWHIKGDVLPLLDLKWDMIIGFPPCTYLTNAAACRLYPKKGVLDVERYKKGLAAKEFFLKLLNADCSRIAIENPISSKIYELPKHTQEIQPYYFGHPYTKRTRLWLKGLPKLQPTNIVEPIGTYVPSCTSRKLDVCKGAAKRGNDARNRSKTFKGIAEAMAIQFTK
ncbi:MAG: DNA cytosine methyltransferase [Cellulosilyticum sp.]|nr:DNA cytosine methyltransferase [Cellulosilyticum sp.]